MTNNIDIEKTNLHSIKDARSHIIDDPASFQDTKGFIQTLEKNKNKDMQKLHKFSYAALMHSRPHHLGGHGDCTLLTRLFNALGKQYRKEYLKKWITEFAPIKMKDGQFVYSKKSKDQTWDDWKHKDAFLTPWFQPNEQKLGAQPIFFNKACDDIEKMLDNKIKLIQAGPDKINCAGEIKLANDLIKEMQKFKDEVMKIHRDFDIAAKQKALNSEVEIAQ